MTVQPSSARDDEFSWLESPKDGAALDWARRQTAAAKAHFSEKPLYQEVFAELSELLQKVDPRPPTYAFFGQRFVRHRRDMVHPYGILEMAERDPQGRPQEWQPVLDIVTLRAAEGRPLELHWHGQSALCPEPSTGRCLLQFSAGGGDEAELREFDLLTGQFVTDGFRAPVSRVQVAWLSKDQLLISTTLSGTERTAAGWAATVQIWTRGTPLSSAPVVAQAKATDALFFLSATGHGTERVGVINRTIDYSTFALSYVDQQGRVTPIDLPLALKHFGVLATTDSYLFVQLARPGAIGGRAVPAEALVAYDLRASTPSGERASVVYIPGEDELVADAVFGVAGTAARVYFVVSRHLSRRIVAASIENGHWKITDELEAGVGITLRFAGADPAGEDFIADWTGFTQPERFDLMRPGQPAHTLYAQDPVFDASAFVTEIRRTNSSDGTRVDYYLLRPKSSAHPGDTPTLMTGYGAFGITLPPSYLGLFVGGPELKLWLERGGAFVLPIIRGGGEHGAAWHQSAMRENRRRSYEDFIAVAQALVRERFTTSNRIGVFGTSNGGLLSATVATLRPDAFGAIISDVPLTDMIKFPEMGMGGAWTDEYGDPKDPAMRKVLLSYSPYHNVRAAVAYPPFLITISTEDNRVGPGHARKLAAALQKCGATVYLCEEEEGGHGVSDPIRRPGLIALRMTFLIDALMS